MTDLDVQVTIGTPTGPVLLESPGACEVVGVGVGGRTWRRVTVEGTYVHGRALVGAVLATQTLTVHLRVRGASWVAAMNRYQEIVDAVAQHTYTVTVAVEGRTDTYTCEPADITPVAGDLIGKFHAMENMQEYLLRIPVDPT